MQQSDNTMENTPMDRFKSLEEVGISIRAASVEDVPRIEEFLSRPDIDSLFTPALSDPARGISIHDRVEKKFKNGVWMIAVHDNKVVGCMAVVPSNLSTEVPQTNPEKGVHISQGVSFGDWGVEKIMELSTVVTDRSLRDTLKVKGLGAELLNQCKAWVKRSGNGAWGFVTDSWVGGDMGGFVAAMNEKAYGQWLRNRAIPTSGEKISFDTLVRIYSDPSKRGVDGPPTVVYGIPIEDRDWAFFSSKQKEITQLNALYAELERARSA